MCKQIINRHLTVALADEFIVGTVQHAHFQDKFVEFLALVVATAVLVFPALPTPNMELQVVGQRALTRTATQPAIFFKHAQVLKKPQMLVTTPPI